MFGFFWHRIPFFRFLIPLVAGILLAFYHDFGIVYLVLFFLFFCAIILIQVYLKSIYQKSFLQGVLIFLAFFSIGFYSTYNQISKRSSAALIFHSNSNFVLKIMNLPSLKSNRIVCTAEVFTQESFSNGESSFSNAIVYFDDSLYHSVKHGFCYLVKPESLKNITAALNPGEFDYKEYLELKGVLKQVDFTKILPVQFYIEKPAFPYSYSVSSQIFIRELLQEYIPEQDIRAVALALLYGYDDEISKDLSNQYAVTGTLHVLAVSGMHVGLLFMVLDFFLIFMEKKNLTRIVKAIFILASIWFYSLLCGLSPSIIRAAVMISFFVISKVLNRRYNPVNTLSSAAFFMLVLNPALLFDAGFQLSFFAVLGLSLFYQSIYLWFEPKSWLSDQIWKLIAASVAAQLTTFPLSLYYFHQFPIIFPISNLLIIPLTTLAIYAGIILLVCSFFSSITYYIAYAFKAIISVSNYLAASISKLPFCALSGIYISQVNTIFIFLISFCLFAFIYHRKLWQLKAFFIFILIYLVFELQTDFKNINRSFCRIYAFRNQTCLLLTSGNNAFLFCDSSYVVKRKCLDLISQEHFSSIQFINTENHLINLNCNGVQITNHSYFLNQAYSNQSKYFISNGNHLFHSSQKTLKPCTILDLSDKDSLYYNELSDNSCVKRLLKSGAFEVSL
jgi:competence protein ComEC